MADIKNLLKEARKLIDEKNFQEAQECCKNILRKDKQNYFGLVLLGKSLQDSDQAPLAYQKAISCKSDHPLAWQGLAHYYEQKDDNPAKTKLVHIYDEILKLQIEEDKALEVITKLGQLGKSLKSGDALRTLARYLTQEHDPKLMKAAQTQFLELLNADIQCITEDIPLVVDVLQNLISENPSDSLQVLLANILLQKSDFPSTIEEIMNMKCFLNNVLLREWYCQMLFKKYVEVESFFGFPIEDHVDIITSGIEHSKYPGLLKSIISFDKGDFVEAYKQCVPLINFHEADVTEATFVLKCLFKLNKWPVAQKLATNFLTKAKDQNFAMKLKKYLFVSLSKQHKWKQAISVVKDIPLQNLDIHEKAMLTECYIEVNESVDHLMPILKDTEYSHQLQALLLIKQGKLSETVHLLETVENNSMTLFYLGLAYWKLERYDQCLTTLLKAAKVNSGHAKTFFYLGHFYHYHKDDFQKARKCYEKAYSLDSTDNDILKSLSDAYTRLLMKDADVELLTEAQKNMHTVEQWVNFRLGLHYLNRRDWNNSITNFQSVIKYDQNNLSAFEHLADAYYGRGSFTSALRVYKKVMALDPDRSSHCLTRIGYIHNLLTQYDDAVSTFQKVLEINPSSLLALKGISETWMKIAKKKKSAKLYGSAKDCAQNAVEYITKALNIEKQFVCLWKLLADTLMFITKLPNTYAKVYIQQTFDGPHKDAVQKEKLDIFLQAIACYSYLAKRQQHLASYDLASAYLDFYLETKKDTHGNIAFNFALQCVREKPSVWRSWNLLGRICLFVKKFDIAQHCFIKALLLTRKWSVPKIWCNLGTLYLKLKLYKLANYCFWRGQSILPSYPQSWIGQALIAEVIRKEEAMDLFRHASRLGYHPESALGYADWVCRTLNDMNHKEDPDYKYVIEGLHAIPYAMDLVEWYLAFDPKNACACSILGILQERSGLIMAALKTYEKALDYAAEDKTNIAHLNLARIYLRVGKYDEAITAYKAITEASLNSASGLALALFKKGLYEESYSAYDTALHWLSNDDNEKSDLLVAMAGIVYMFKGADDAKTILFHSIQVSQKKPTAYSLLSICSLGLIHSDQSLSKLALSELKKYEKNRNFGYDIGFLKSYLLVKENNVEEAIKVLSNSLHDHPSIAELWGCMAQYCLRCPDKRARVASYSAQRAMCAVRQSECAINCAQMIAIASIAEHIAGNPVKALQLAKAGLHVYPSQTEIWAALLFTLNTQKQWVQKRHWMLNVAGYMRRQLDTSRPLSRWVGVLEKKLVY